jgi:hypothetical protein
VPVLHRVARLLLRRARCRYLGLLHLWIKHGGGPRSGRVTADVGWTRSRLGRTGSGRRWLEIRSARGSSCLSGVEWREGREERRVGWRSEGEAVVRRAMKKTSVR